MGSTPEHADPLKSPQFAGMRPVGGLRGGLRGSARLRLEVAMDQPRGVGAGDSASRLDQYIQDLGPPPGALLRPLPERQPGDELHGDPHVITEHADVIDRDDVRVGQPREGLRLPQYQCAIAAVQFLGDRRLDQLQRDLAIELRIVGREHRPHRAGAELAEQHVATHGAPAGERVEGVRARRFTSLRGKLRLLELHAAIFAASWARGAEAVAGGA
jgi:hypothetical protein